MRPPTANDISRDQHGPYNAVDYRAKDQANNWRKGIYAPCDLRITAYGLNGDAGLQIQAYDKEGRRHGFAHTESMAVPLGANVQKGQLIGTMGFTGLTKPDDVPEGTHLHHTIKLPSGQYVYPPSLITEPFGGGDMDKHPYTDKDAENVSQLTGYPLAIMKGKVDWNDAYYSTIQPEFVKLQRRIDELQKTNCTPKERKLLDALYGVVKKEG